MLLQTTATTGRRPVHDIYYLKVIPVDEHQIQTDNRGLQFSAVHSHTLPRDRSNTH